MDTEKIMIKYGLEIKALETILSSMGRVKRVISEFDGKMYNKKFNDRLREVFKRVEGEVGISMYSSKYEHIENEVILNINVNNISHSVQKEHGVDYTYPRIHNQESLYGFKVFDKRIIAKNWIENLEKHQKSLENQLNVLKSHNNEDYLKDIYFTRKRITEEVMNFNKNIDNVLYDEFRIK